MRVTVITLLAGGLAASVWLGAAASGAEEPTAALSKEDKAFIESCYAPPVDRGAGSLLPGVLKLRDELRGLSMTPAAPRHPQPPQPTGKSDEEAAAEKDGWTRVVSSPVVGNEALARAYYNAKKYEEAAAIFREMIKATPDDSHAILMLGMCEMNLGNKEEARKLLDEAATRDKRQAPWVRWENEMQDMIAPPEQTDEQQGQQKEGE